MEIKDRSDNILIKIFHSIMSFIVGVSAFFIIKLCFMIPINLVTTADNLSAMEALGSVLLLFSIYLSYKYTKYINGSGTLTSRNIKRVITVLLGLFSMVMSTALLVVMRSL